MNPFAMAFRNLGRNRRRSLLAMLSVFISIFVAVFADGFVSGVVESMTRNITKNQTGDVNIETSRYLARERFMPASAAIPDSSKIEGAIRAIPALQGKIDLVESRVQFGVILSSEAGNKVAVGIGGDPATEKRLLMLNRSIQPGGRYLEANGEVILGWKLASDLGLGIGDKLKVLVQKADYGLGFKQFKIVGIFRTGLETFDDASLQVGIQDARDLMGLDQGASQILVMLKQSEDSPWAAQSIASGLAAAGFPIGKADEGHRIQAISDQADKLVVRSWTSIGEVAAIVQLFNTSYSLIEFIIILLGAIIIANIMMMVVLERRREIGILKSMGMEQPRILGLFLAEGMLLGAFGSLAGCLAGLALNSFLSRQGMDMSRIIAGTNYQMDSIIYPRINLVHTLGFFALGVLVAMVISYLPSRNAARMDPIEAIRSV